jgi:hypothetical protein
MSATHAYVARRRTCGHAFMLIVDDGAKSNAREIASAIRRDGIIERVLLDDARKAVPCPASCPDRPKQKARP